MCVNVTTCDHVYIHYFPECSVATLAPMSLDLATACWATSDKPGNYIHWGESLKFVSECSLRRRQLATTSLFHHLWPNHCTEYEKLWDLALHDRPEPAKEPPEKKHTLQEQ